MDIERDFVLSKNNKNNMDIKKEIKNFWNKKPCGTSGNIEKEINEEYFNKIREKRYKLEPFILSTAKFQEWKNKNVLEIGCGIGTDAVEFAKNQAQYTGIDLSLKSIELCKKQFEIYNLNGQQVYQWTVDEGALNSGAYYKTVQASISGIYIYRISGNEVVHQGKIFIGN